MKIQNEIRLWALLGLTLMFSACNDDDIQQLMMGVRTAAVGDITETTVVCGLKIDATPDGVDEVGLCWGKTPNPTIDANKKNVELQGVEYTITLDGLRSGTLYYVRSYLKSGSQVKYGDTRSFTTLGQLAYTLPYAEHFREDVFPPLYWSQIDADGDGYLWEKYARYPGVMSLSSDDDPLKPENYFVSPKIEVMGTNIRLKWSVGVTSKNYPKEYYKVMVAETPFTAENYTNHGKMVFDETLVAEGYRNLLSREADLSAYSGKDIYVAWVHCESVDNDAMYFTDVEIVSAENSSPATPPVLMLNEAVVSGSDYSLLAEIVDDGGLTVVKKGFCYGKNQQPGAGDHVIELAGYSDFKEALKGLEGGVTYYVRAFATNRIGTSYSKEISFTTSSKSVETLFSENFDTDFTGRWALIDKDGDGEQWEYNASKKRAESRSYKDGNALTPENYMITPAIQIPTVADTLEITFTVADYSDDDFKDSYKLVISSEPITASNCGSATAITEYIVLETGAWTGKSHRFSLEGWAGKTAYIGFLHGNSTNQSRILIDDIVIHAITYN